MQASGVAIMKIQSISSKAITISVSMFPLWGRWAALSSAVLGRRNSLGAAWAQCGVVIVLLHLVVGAAKNTTFSGA